LEANRTRAAEGIARGGRFLAAFFPPDLVSQWRDIQEGLLESLTMAAVSTVLGIALSVPFALGAARNIAPPPVHLFCRGIIAVSRTFQEVIIAIPFVAMSGSGPFAGMPTLAFSTIGLLGKPLAEDIEDNERGQAEAMRATGASWLRLLPRLIGLSDYRFDIDFRGSAVPPRWTHPDQLWRPLWDMINIGTIGTLLAIVIAVPVAFLAAHNTTPSMLLVRPVALFVVVASRSVNSLIWAMILVVIPGPGMLAGVLSIGLRSIGFIAKLLHEAIEEIDASQVEAIRATGASRPQVFGWGVVPLVLPAFAGIVVFRWDINIREATVLGLVGAGGIGVKQQNPISTLAWPQVSLILLQIFAAVLVSGWVSARVRHAII